LLCHFPAYQTQNRDSGCTLISLLLVTSALNPWKTYEKKFFLVFVLSRFDIGARGNHRSEPQPMDLRTYAGSSPNIGT
jgi:hypothetical protein